MYFYNFKPISKRLLPYCRRRETDRSRRLGTRSLRSESSTCRRHPPPPLLRIRLLGIYKSGNKSVDLVDKRSFCQTEVPFKLYKEVQLDFTPEIEVFHMVFKRCNTKYLKYFGNLRSKTQLDHPELTE